MMTYFKSLLAARLLKVGSVGTANQSTREAWLGQTLASITAGSRILDAGAGELQYKNLCSHLQYVSQDFAEYDGRGDGSGLQTGSWDQSRLDIVSDITQIPEPDNSFDAIMCIEVLEHLPNPVDALKELVRLLKPNGQLIVTSPFCSLTHFAPYFYQTGYSRYFYEYWFQELGLEILDMQWNGNYFEYLAQELRRLPAIGQTHASGRLTFVERSAVAVILRALGRFTQRNVGSEQIMAYGLHVLARKISRPYS